MPDLKTHLLFDTSRAEQSRAFITVCLSLYNFEKTVLRAVNSLLAQTFDDFEIIISDDGSTDKTVETLLTFLKTYSGKIRIRLYQATENKGIFFNRLRGMFLGEGELFVLTDGDDFSMPERLEKIAECWQQLHPRPSLLATNAYHWYEDNQKANGECVHAESRFYPPGDPVYGRYLAFSAGFVISRKLFEAFRNSMPETRIIADDPVFARRALLCDGMYFLQTPLFYYGTSRNSASGKGVSGKNWILDRIHRWDLLLQDIAHVRSDHAVPETMRKQIMHERKKMEVDCKGIDCPLYQWPFFWIWMFFLSPSEAVAMLKKRLKLIFRGSVNATWKKIK